MQFTGRFRGKSRPIDGVTEKTTHPAGFVRGVGEWGGVVGGGAPPNPIGRFVRFLGKSPRNGGFTEKTTSR